MSDKKGKFRFNLAMFFIDHSPDCSKCKGIGKLAYYEKVDSITHRSKSSDCPQCDGYGKKLSWFTKLLISFVPD